MADRPNTVIVQRITTSWTKRTRGAEGRERRARLPVAYPLPDRVLVSRSASVCHSVVRGEASDYAERVALSFDAAPTARVGSGANSAVQLTHREANLEVAFMGAATDTGQPVRAQMPSRSLLSGQVATVRFNGRFVGWYDGWYEDKIVHIAYDVTPSRDLFLGAAPAFVIDARVDLW
jgi:hypothetical protein